MTVQAFAQLRQDLREDLETYLAFSADFAPGHRAAATRAKRLSALLTPSGLACAHYRLSHYAWARGWPRIARAFATLNLALTRVSIAPASRIGPGLYIPHPSTGIVFQGDAGRDLRLYAGSAVMGILLPQHAGALSGTPRLGDGVSVGAKAVVRGPVTVGARVRIGFNAIVQRDVPADAIVVAATVRLASAPRAPAQRAPPQA